MKSALLIFAAAAALTAQTQPVPRTSDGHPDLTGVFQAASNRRGTWEEGNIDQSANPPARTAPARTARGPVRQPAPYKPDAAQKVLESFNRRAIDDPTAFCMKPGVPRVTSVGLFPMQIVQTPKTIVMIYEYMDSFRLINMNAKHPDDLEPSFMGDSVAHWEGDTLVVDVTGFNTKTWLIGAGTFHTEALHVTERYNMADRDMINYEATMEDPNVLTKPWVYRTTIMRREGTRLREYECEENNQDPASYEKLLKDESVFRRK